jgi:ABC-type dipeptide/oligopeptide/nickel transport system permease subunit
MTALDPEVVHSTDAGGPAETVRSESPRARFVRRFRRQGFAMAALGFVLLLIIAALFAPWIAPKDPLDQELRNSFAGPGRDHWLGTDRLGRDTFSRLIFGARYSLLAAAQAVAVAFVLGVPVGILAGYLRGWFDAIVSTIADAILSIPAIVLALAIIGMLKPNLTNAMIAIGVVYAPRLYRVVRGAAMTVREETFVEAARASGVSTVTIARTHVLPNVLSPLVVQISLALGFAVLAEAGLSFLGLGVQPPDASWGVMLGQSTSQLENHPELVLTPGIAIMLTVLAFNVLGDGLNDSIGREIRSE